MGLKHSEGSGHWVLGTQRTDIKDWWRLLGPGCVKGLSAVDGQQEEVREALVEVTWV